LLLSKIIFVGSFISSQAYLILKDLANTKVISKLVNRMGHMEHLPFLTAHTFLEENGKPFCRPKIGLIHCLNESSCIFCWNDKSTPSALAG